MLFKIAKVLKFVFPITVLLFLSPIECTTTASVFAKFPNEYFIETGTYIGDGIQNAIDAGFKNIYSIELSEYYYRISYERFKNNPNVHVFWGDSSEILGLILQTINAPVTFWLDGHWSGGGTACGSERTPILKELAIIKEHHIKNHTILLDDIRCCGTPDFDSISLEEIVRSVLQINPRYKISFEDGHIPKDVLVAKI